MNRDETIEELKKMKCPIDETHQLRVKSFKGKKFVMQCPDCKEKLGITNEIQGEITNK